MPRSKNRVYLDENGKATTKAEEGVTLLAGAGSPVSQDLVDKYGLEVMDEEEEKGTAGVSVVDETPNDAKAAEATAKRTKELGDITGENSPAKNKIFSDDHPSAKGE